GLPHRHAANGGRVGHLETNLVGVTPHNLREVAADDLHVRPGVVPDLPANDTVEGHPNAKEGTQRRVQANVRAGDGEGARHEHRVTQIVALRHELGPHRRQRSKVRELVVVIHRDEVVALDELVDQIRVSVLPKVQLDLVRKDGLAVPDGTVHDRTIVPSAQQVSPGQSILVVEDGEVSRAGDRPGKLGGQLGVQAVNVLPGELLRHRDEDGELDRREADLRTELVPANRLGRTLTVLQGGTGTNLTGLRESVRERHNGLVDTDRDLPGQTHQRRLLAGLAKDVADDRTGKSVRRQIVKTTLKRVVSLVSVLNEVLSH